MTYNFYSYFCLSSNVQNWLLLNCVLFGGWICFVRQMWCLEPLHREQLFFILAFLLFTPGQYVEWIRKISNLKQQLMILALFKVVRSPLICILNNLIYNGCLFLGFISKDKSLHLFKSVSARKTILFYFLPLLKFCDHFQWV